MMWETPPGEQPFFSLCIPQYGRYPYLKKQLSILRDQTLRSFEVCISDGGSPEARHQEIVDFLDHSGIAYRYAWSATGLPYDVNTRTAIGLARGRYCVLMGNDDGLAEPETLQQLMLKIEQAGFPGVVLSDFADATTRLPARRIRETCAHGSGPQVAADHFRNFSFVSGIVMDREAAQSVATDRWDGSEMYQTFVGCRLIASGLPLLELDLVTVIKDLQVDGEPLVDSYLRKAKVNAWPIRPRPIPLRLLGQVVMDSINPYVRSAHEKQRLIRLVIKQLIGITYPFWLLSYRRLQSWPYSVGIALAMRPIIVLEGMNPNSATRAYARVLYGAATMGGLLAPVRLFERMRRPLYALAKGARFRRRSTR